MKSVQFLDVFNRMIPARQFEQMCEAYAPRPRTPPKLAATQVISGLIYHQLQEGRHTGNQQWQTAWNPYERFGARAAATVVACGIVRANDVRGALPAGRSEHAPAEFLSRIPLGGRGWYAIQRDQYASDFGATAQGGKIVLLAFLAAAGLRGRADRISRVPAEI